MRKFIVCLSIPVVTFIQACNSNKPTPSQCPIPITGTPWTPQAPGVSPSNHDPNVSLTSTVLTATGPITGLAQGIASREVTFTLDMSQDLGQFGSLTLMAQTVNFPSSLQGNAFAYLISLNDGTHEYVNLTSSCNSAGLYTCSKGSCSVNSNCTTQWPSAFLNRDHWEQSQGYSSSAWNYPSVNIFPTCNWEGGSGQSNLPNLGVSSEPSCAFNSTYFPNGTTHLRYGVNYTAKYVIVADSYVTLNGYTSGIKLTAIQKKSTRESVGGAIDMNVILVGTSNVQASRTAKGQQSLNTMLANLSTFFGQSNSNLKLGTVRAVEWPCLTGGDQYANANLSELPTLFASASNALPAGLDTKAMNVFLVSTIQDDTTGGDANLTILGVDGAIGGPAMNGTAISGLAVSTFDSLGTFNSACPLSTAICPLEQQDASFFEFSETVAHEKGHYYRLNHLSEATGTLHDPIQDTPICTATENFSGADYITIRSCLISDTNLFPGTGTSCRADCGTYSTTNGTYCPSATACEFNYLMWWTTKNFSAGKSDGVMFSPQQGVVMNYHPLVQ